MVSQVANFGKAITRLGLEDIFLEKPVLIVPY